MPLGPLLSLLIVMGIWDIFLILGFLVVEFQIDASYYAAVVESLNKSGAVLVPLLLMLSGMTGYISTNVFCCCCCRLLLLCVSMLVFLSW